VLIQLTQLQPGGGPGKPVLVGSDHIIHAEGAAGGSMLLLTTGKRVDVSEPLDHILDLQDGAHDPDARGQAAGQRKALREQRERAEAQRKADADAEKARREAHAAQAEADRLRKGAEGAAAAARAALERAGLTRTKDVTPEGIDLLHPAPQPHQPAPVGTASPDDPTAQPPIGSPDYEKARAAEKEAAGKQPGGAPPAERTEKARSVTEPHKGEPAKAEKPLKGGK